MKKMIFLLLILVLVGCGTVRSIFFDKNHANKEDFSVTNNIIHYKGKPLAELQAMT